MSWTLQTDYAARVDATVADLARDGFGARLGVVLGSGLGNVVDGMEIGAQRSFGDIAGFHAPTVKAHHGRLVQARHAGVDAVVLQGRLHGYEGLSMAEVVFPIATLLGLGCSTILLTNAAGGLDPDHRAGDLMVLTGLIDFHWIDATRGLLVPPAGIDPEISLRAAARMAPYDRELAFRIVQAGADEGVAVRTGTYVSLWGPNYETPREIGFLRRIGGQAVGMSTGPETALATRMGARVAGLSCITNVAVEAGGEVVTHEEVIEVGAARRDDTARLILASLPALEKE